SPHLQLISPSNQHLCRSSAVYSSVHFDMSQGHPLPSSLEQQFS
ncbi:unnamed protein product, partial [Fusarium fujikuroi]